MSYRNQNQYLLKLSANFFLSNKDELCHVVDDKKEDTFDKKYVCLVVSVLFFYKVFPDKSLFPAFVSQILLTNSKRLRFSNFLQFRGGVFSLVFICNIYR